MMLKNEDVLLEPWLLYHGSLFGFENLYVFDNGSTIPEVLETLTIYQAKGINLDTQHSSVAEYALKGNIIAECIQRLQTQHEYDIVFPMDCDEFIVLKEGEEATVDRDKIMAYVEAILPGESLLRIDTQFFNVINRPGEFARQSYTKTAVVLDGTFTGSDHGHHYCTTVDGSNYRNCEFAYVHYHYKPLSMLRDHARAKLAPFVDIDDPEALAGFHGAGHHLCPYLTMTDEEFQNWHKGDSFYRFDAFNEKLASLHTSIPF